MTSPRNLTLQVTVDPGTPSTIFTAEGFGEYVRLNVVEFNGLDLTGETFAVGLSPLYGTPAVDAWKTPLVVLGAPAGMELGAPVPTASLYLFVGTPTDSSAVAYYPPAGRMWPWVRATDHPELSPVLAINRTVTTDGPPSIIPSPPGSSPNFLYGQGLYGQGLYSPAA